MINVLGLALYGPLAASHRVRLSNYREGLLLCGVNLEVHSLLDDEYLKQRFQNKRPSLQSLLRAFVARLRTLSRQKKYDLMIINCELFPLFPGFLERALLSIPYIYDFDDAFFLRYRFGKLKALGFLLGNKFEGIISGASAVSAGNSNLAMYARQFNSATEILPSVVDTEIYRPIQVEKSELFTVGWVGSPTTAKYLDLLVAPLQQLSKVAPVRFVVVGGSAPKISGVEVVELPWKEETEVEIINTFDVGVMPLPDDEWARGKCAFKLIQYMACGIPVVASRVGANIDVVSSDCGILAGNDSEWHAGLERLRVDATGRADMGVAARVRIKEQYSLSRNLPQLERLIKQICSAKTNVEN